MKLINFEYTFRNGLEIPLDIFMKAHRQYVAIEEQMNKKYGELAQTTKINTQAKLAILMVYLNNLMGKTILDIGCGAKNSWDYGATVLAKEDRYYEPWLCRVTHELGAEVTGIDGACSPEEEYKHIQRNLLGFEEAVKEIPDNSIDLACAWSFFDSPSLADGRTMFRTTVKGLERKVKPEGFFVFESVGTGVFDKPDWERFLHQREQQLQEGARQ